MSSSRPLNAAPRRRSRARFLAQALLVLLVAASPLRSDDELLNEWKSRRDSVATWHAQLKPAAAADQRIHDLFRLSVENKLLAFASAAPATPGNVPVRTRIENIPGTGVLYIHRDPETNALDRFDLGIMDFPEPKRINNLQIQCNADKGQLVLIHSVQADGGMHQTMLIQERGSATGTTGFIQLVVSGSTPGALGANFNSQQLNFAANDSVSLVREHPEQANLYVRPLLRQLDQEPLLAPDTQTAWQVFRETRKTDPAIAGRVNALLPRLNDRDNRIRRAAFDELTRIGRDAADVLERLDRARFSPEQNLLIDRFLIRCKPIPDAEVARLRVDPTFLLDALYCDDRAVRRSAVDRLRSMFRPDLDFDIDAPLEARSPAIAAFRSQLTPNR